MCSHKEHTFINFRYTTSTFDKSCTMSNSNVADISIFESLQANANAQMGMPSGMAVFNATYREIDQKKMQAGNSKQQIKQAKEGVESAEKFLKETRAELKFRERVLANLSSNATVGERKRAQEAVDKLKGDRLNNRILLADWIKRLLECGIQATSVETNKKD